jgi:transposase InsO family protein
VAIDGEKLPGGFSFMVLIDRYSSYCDALRVSSESSADIVRFLDRIFSRIGSPNVVLSDNYMTCRSSEFQQFLSLRGVTH